MTMAMPLLTRAAHSCSAEESEALAASLGALLQPPFLLTLSGDLGAGKTAFTRGLVEGVHAGEGEFVASPTYAVCHAYETDPPVHHYDLYRLAGEDDLESVGFRESLDVAIVIVEWPEQVESITKLADIRATLRCVDDTERHIVLSAFTERGREVLHALPATWLPG